MCGWSIWAWPTSTAFLDEIAALDPCRRAEIGFTGGEPFMNREIVAMAAEALDARLPRADPDQRHGADAAPGYEEGLLRLLRRPWRAPDAPGQHRPLLALPCTRTSADRQLAIGDRRAWIG